MFACTHCNHIERRLYIAFCPRCGKPMTDMLPYVECLLEHGANILAYSIALFMLVGFLSAVLLKLFTY